MGFLGFLTSQYFFSYRCSRERGTPVPISLDKWGPLSSFTGDMGAPIPISLGIYGPLGPLFTSAIGTPRDIGTPFYMVVRAFLEAHSWRQGSVRKGSKRSDKVLD